MNVIDTPIFPTKVTVEITYCLTDRSLVVRCKDKHHDMGLQQLNVGEKYIFCFYPNYFLPIILFFCHFVWLKGDHHFDIYV